MRRARSAAAPVEPWSRQRLVSVGAALLAALLVLVGGLAYGVLRLLRPGPDRPGQTVVAGPPPAGLSREEIAAAPMASIAPAQGRPGARMATTRPASMLVPEPTRDGPAGVATGFPHTPAGAVGQLGALLPAVLERMDIEHTAAVYAAWSVPDAPPVEAWPVLASVRAFLESARLPRLEPGHAVQATPVGAQIKGSDGPDWTVACVLLTVRARVKAEARISYGNCERMVWLGRERRWVIGPGAFPARAPHTWPGSEAMLTAGWRTWEEELPR